MAVSREEINALYQDLFGRDAQDAGAQYWMSQVESGAIAPETLRDTLIQSAQGSDITAYRERGTRLQQQAAEQARLDAEERYRQQQEAAEARAQRQIEQQRALAEQARLEQQAQLDMLRQQQEQQQQFFQTLASTTAQGKGGAQQQQQAAPVFADEPAQTATQQPDYQYGSYNPYAGGYGMGYQSPGMEGQYMPRYGMLGPSGFGAYGGYSPYDVYAPSYSPYSPYSPYGGGKGGYMSPRERASMPPEGYTQANPDLPEAVATPDVFPTTAGDTTMVDDTPMAIKEEATSGVLAGESDPNMAPMGYPSKGGYGALPRRRPMPPMYGGKGGYYR